MLQWIIILLALIVIFVPIIGKHSKSLNHNHIAETTEIPVNIEESITYPGGAIGDWLI